MLLNTESMSDMCLGISDEQGHCKLHQGQPSLIGNKSGW